MLYRDFAYVDTSVNGVHNRNNIKHIAQFRPTGTDCYKTYFRFRQDLVQHVKKTGSVKGYDGPAYADYFPLDFDNEDLEAALKMARDTISRLEVNFDVDPKHIPIFFSGLKGFHIYLPSQLMGIRPAKNIAQIFKIFARQLLADWPAKCDPKIYDIVRLLRVAGTINGKSGLYKIPLQAVELHSLSVDEIRKLAKAPRSVSYDLDVCENETLKAMYAHATETVQSKPLVNGMAIDGKVPPKYAKLCYHSLLEGVGQGERDSAAYRLASYFQKQGYSSDMTEGALQAWNLHNRPPLTENEITAKVKSSYADNSRNDFGCNDELLKKYCSDTCYLKNRNKAPVTSDEVVFNIDEAEAKYKVYTNNLKTRLIRIDFPGIGEAMRGIAPGEVCTILARSGVGKTATLLNMLFRVGLANKSPQIFFSMEQPVPQIYERMAQIANGLRGRAVEEMYCDKKPEREAVAQKTKQMFSHVWLVEKCGLTVADIKQIVLNAQQNRLGGKCNLVAIDYLNLISGNGNSYERTSSIIREIKELSKDLDAAVIVLVQVSRVGGDGSIEPTVDMARDSGAVEESSDFILGLWRPDIAKAVSYEDEVLKVKLLKNKKGRSGLTCDLKFIKPYLRLDRYDVNTWIDEKDIIPGLGVVVEDPDCPF